MLSIFPARRILISAISVWSRSKALSKWLNSTRNLWTILTKFATSPWTWSWSTGRPRTRSKIGRKRLEPRFWLSKKTLYSWLTITQTSSVKVYGILTRARRWRSLPRLTTGISSKCLSMSITLNRWPRSMMTSMHNKLKRKLRRLLPGNLRWSESMSRCRIRTETCKLPKRSWPKPLTKPSIWLDSNSR